MYKYIFFFNKIIQEIKMYMFNLIFQKFEIWAISKNKIRPSFLNLLPIYLVLVILYADNHFL